MGPPQVTVTGDAPLVKRGHLISAYRERWNAVIAACVGLGRPRQAGFYMFDGNRRPLQRGSQNIFDRPGDGPRGTLPKDRAIPQCDQSNNRCR